MSKRPKPDLIDDENPELTDEWFARARPAREVLPELIGAEAAAELLKPKRGRPPKVERKRAVNIRLSPEVLEYFRASGPGWQTRVDEALKSHAARAKRAPARRRARRSARQQQSR